MGVTKRILCLANSRKLHGRCVAGKELVDGAAASWVRPVSSRLHQEVSEREQRYRYRDSNDARVLDVIDVPLLHWLPATHQQENWLLDPNAKWTRVGTIGWADLDRLADSVGPLWVNGQSTYNGRNDEVAETDAATLRSSLTLIRVTSLSLASFAPGQAFGNGKRRVQAAFEFDGVKYRLWVTDPVYERACLALPDGRRQLGECFLTISLGQPYNSACYKLVAAIIERSTALGGVQR